MDLSVEVVLCHAQGHFISLSFTITEEQIKSVFDDN